MAGISRSGDAAPVWLSDENGNLLGTAAFPLATSGGGGGGGGGVVTQPTASNLNAQVVGNVDNATTDTGNPVKVGGYVSTAFPTAMTTGQRGNFWVNANGALEIAGIGVTGTDGASNANLIKINNSGAADNTLRPFVTAQMVFNGTSWDRQRGDTNGAYTVSKGSGTIATAQVSVATTSTQVVAARAGRGSVKITNLGTTDVFIGVSGVTTTTGDLLPGTKGASVTVPTNAAVFAVASGAAQTVSVMEVY